MNNYNVRIEETLCKVVEVEAKDENEAYLKVKDMYKNEEIILYPDDFFDVEIEVIE